MATMSRLTREWMEYEGYMYCGKSDDEKHHFVPRQKVMKCSHCGALYDANKHNPPSEY